MNRRKLDNRRALEIIDFELDGLPFTAAVGRFPDGAVSEVFFHRAGKTGSAIETMARDAAVLASLALQRGATLLELRHSLVKLRDGRGAGPVGMLLDLVAGADQGAT